MDWKKRTSPLVAEIRVQAGPGLLDERHVAFLPDGMIGLLFQMTDGSVTHRGSRWGELYVVGTRTRAVYKTVPTVPLALAVRFYPGVAPAILGVPGNELTDRVVRLEDIWGSHGERLRQRLLSATTVDEMLTLLQSAAQPQPHRGDEPSSTRVVRCAVDALTRSAAPLRMTQLAVELRVTPRHLRRVFTSAVGLGPKQFARVIRFQRAFRAVRRNHDWARVALDAGYYDQAHMIRDFRALAGATPSQVRALTFSGWRRASR